MVSATSSDMLTKKVRYTSGTGSSRTIWAATMRKTYFPNPFPDGFYTGNATEEQQVGLPENYYAWQWGDALFVVLDPYWPTSGKGNESWSRTSILLT